MELRSSKINLIKSSVSKSSLSIVASILTIASIGILTRIYSTDSIGVLFILLGTTKFIATIPSGIGRAVKKRCSEQNDDYFQFWLIGTVSLIVLSFLVASLWVLLLTVPRFTIGKFVVKDNYVLSIAFGVLGNGGLSVARKFVDGVSLPTLGQTLTTGLHKGGRLVVALLALLALPAVDVAWLFPLFESGGVIYLFVCCPIIALSRSTSSSQRDISLPSKESLYRVIRFARWSIPNSVFTSLYHQLDVIVLAAFVATSVTGKYESSVRLMGIMFAIPLSISSILEVKVSGLHESGEPFMNEFKTALKASWIPIIIFLVGVVLFGDEILGAIYGSDYLSAHILFIGVTVQLLFQGTKILLEAVFNGSDRPSRITKVTGASLLINPILMLFMVMNWGAVGIIYSNILTETFMIAYLYHEL